MLHNLLKLNERINNISIFPPEFIIPRLIYEDTNKYKIIMIIGHIQEIKVIVYNY